MLASHAANKSTFKVTTPTERAIQLTRLFDAPPALVFDAMTKPEHVRKWWGALGEGYSVPVCEIDLRVGGSWKFVNSTPGGEDVTFYGVYREIVRPSRVVSTEVFAPYPDAGSLVTTILSEEKGKTRLTVTAEYPSVDVRDMVISTGMEYGAGLSYDKLDEVASALQGA